MGARGSVSRARCRGSTRLTWSGHPHSGGCWSTRWPIVSLALCSSPGGCSIRRFPPRCCRRRARAWSPSRRPSGWSRRRAWAEPDPPTPPRGRPRKDLVFGQFRRADELLHRGPLGGRPRREAVAAFEDVLKLRPAFGPALQHLAWVRIAEGDSAGAADALARAEPRSQPTDPSFATLALLELASAWRFARPTEAAQRSEALVRAARAAGIVELDAGARYLPGFGAPQGALWFADRLASEAAFARSAGIVRTLALVALGRPDSALVVARALADRFPELRIFVLELSAATLAFDADSARFGELWPPARAALASEAERRRGAGGPPPPRGSLLAVGAQAPSAPPPQGARPPARGPRAAAA